MRWSSRTGIGRPAAANAIAENLYAQVDEEGNRHVLFDEIIDHRTNGREVKQQDAFVVTSNGNKRRRETTFGMGDPCAMERWQLHMGCTQRYEGILSGSIGRIRYRRTHLEEPAFAWWVPFTIRKRNRVLSKVKSKYWVRTHKFGIKIPKNGTRSKSVRRREW
jgi:hypothetical protein